MVKKTAPEYISLSDSPPPSLLGDMLQVMRTAMRCTLRLPKIIMENALQDAHEYSSIEGRDKKLEQERMAAGHEAAHALVQALLGGRKIEEVFVSDFSHMRKIFHWFCYKVCPIESQEKFQANGGVQVSGIKNMAFSYPIKSDVIVYLAGYAYEATENPRVYLDMLGDVSGAAISDQIGHTDSSVPFLTVKNRMHLLALRDDRFPIEPRTSDLVAICMRLFAEISSLFKQPKYKALLERVQEQVLEQKYISGKDLNAQILSWAAGKEVQTPEDHPVLMQLRQELEAIDVDAEICSHYNIRLP